MCHTYVRKSQRNNYRPIPTYFGLKPPRFILIFYSYETSNTTFNGEMDCTCLSDGILPTHIGPCFAWPYKFFLPLQLWIKCLAFFVSQKSLLYTMDVGMIYILSYEIWNVPFLYTLNHDSWTSRRIFVIWESLYCWLCLLFTSSCSRFIMGFNDSGRHTIVCIHTAEWERERIYALASQASRAVQPRS